MSRFNATTKTAPDTVNREGAPAYELGSESKLISLLLGSFLSDQFYRSGDETLEELKTLVAANHPEFAARAAIYARDTFGMRSVSHVVAAELCRYVKGEAWLRRFLSRVVLRPDDVTEILSCWLSTYGKPIPNAMKRGLGDALSGFDAYRLGKYKAEGKALSLVDAVNLCHPKHTEQLAALVRGTLAPPETWEVELTRAGQAEDKDKAKAAVWHNLLSEHKLGYFALLRNLRNIIAQSPGSIPMACEQLTDAEVIRKSRVLPFRFLSAWDALDDMPRDVGLALSQAVDIAVANIPTLPGKTLIAVDGSGSMEGRPVAIAALFASALHRLNDSDVLLFDDVARWAKLNPANPVMTNAQGIIDNATCGGTNFHLIFDTAQKPYDRIVILSDMQAWIARGEPGIFWRYCPTCPEDAHKEYKRRTGADPFVYCFDLQGYGTAQFPAKRVTQLSGWSDKAFDYMLLAEKGEDAMVKAVKEVVF